MRAYIQKYFLAAGGQIFLLFKTLRHITQKITQNTTKTTLYVYSLNYSHTQFTLILNE